MDITDKTIKDAMRIGFPVPNVDTRYPWAYGFLRSAVDGVLEKILVTHSPTVTEQEVYNRLKDAVERIDEELAR